MRNETLKKEETARIYKEYWIETRNRAIKGGSTLRFFGVADRSLCGVELSDFLKSNVFIAPFVRKEHSPVLGCEIQIRDDKLVFYYLLSNKDAIEKDFGKKLEWITQPDLNVTHIRTTMRFNHFSDKAYWPIAQKWHIENAETFARVFSKYPASAI